MKCVCGVGGEGRALFIIKFDCVAANLFLKESVTVSIWLSSGQEVSRSYTRDESEEQVHRQENMQARDPAWF